MVYLKEKEKEVKENEPTPLKKVVVEEVEREASHVSSPTYKP